MKYENGQRVVCNGSGRYWVADYSGKKGVIIKPAFGLRGGFEVRFDDGEVVSFYGDEIDPV